MFRKRLPHEETTGMNTFAAKRLRDMAESMNELARTVSGKKEQEGLTTEDGYAAVETAASMVCGNCGGCSLAKEIFREDEGEPYYLYYLLRTFEQKGNLEYVDMPRSFLESCGRKAEYLKQLNSCLGRSYMNLSWKSRFLESRDTVMVEFQEIASILEEFSRRMEEAKDITPSCIYVLTESFRKRHARIENLLVLQYQEGQREVFLTGKMKNGVCMTAKDAAALIGKNLKGDFIPARDGKTILTRNSATFRFIEDGSYRLLFGSARRPREGEEHSGDSFLFKTGLPGQAVMSLSDGMGSGFRAEKDSTTVIELTEQLLETGFSARSTLKLVNTILLLTGEPERPATLDLCLIDCYTGVLDAMKLGAVPTFVMGEKKVDILNGETVPAGIMTGAEPALISRKLWDGDQIIMISDGILEAMPGEDKNDTFRELLLGAGKTGPQETADYILNFALSVEETPRDDMTVMVAGIYGK